MLITRDEDREEDGNEKALDPAGDRGGHVDIGAGGLRLGVGGLDHYRGADHGGTYDWGTHDWGTYDGSADDATHDQRGKRGHRGVSPCFG
jgi:hypothetical protein